MQISGNNLTDYWKCWLDMFLNIYIITMRFYLQAKYILIFYPFIYLIFTSKKMFCIKDFYGF